MASASEPSILLVEDEAVIAMALRAELEEKGYRVVAWVSKAEDVIPAVQRDRPTIVLMDIRLKGDVDGVALAEEIFVCEDIPVVFLSAYSDPGLCLRAGQAGAYGYLTKPVREDALVATLDMAVQKHADLRARRDDAQWLGVALNALDHPLVGLDAEGRVRFMNHAATELTGWVLGEAKGERPRWAEQLAEVAPDEAGDARPVALLTRSAAPVPVRVKKLPSKLGGAVCVIEREPSS